MDNFFKKKSKDIKNTVMLGFGMAAGMGALNAQDAKTISADQNNKITTEQEMTNHNAVDTEAVSFADAQKINQEIDSLENLKDNAENAEAMYALEIKNAQNTLLGIIKSVPGNEQFKDVYSEVEKFIRTSAENYDINTNEGFKKFSSDMEEVILNPMFAAQFNQPLAEKLELFGKKYNGANFGIQDTKVRQLKAITEKNLIKNIVNHTLAEQYIDAQNQELSARTIELNELRGVADASEEK
jgi:hypothetical protein